MNLKEFWEAWWEKNAHMSQHSASDVAMAFAEAYAQYRIDSLLSVAEWLVKAATVKWAELKEQTGEPQKP